tara:strand:- start:1202 stop:1765 length:564 start_codon:yes stop_codon:yes gene_type:complete
MKIPICFLDIILILLVCMILLYNPVTKKEEVPTPPQMAEFILTVHWQSKLNADIDTWAIRVDNPASITGFTRRENDVFILHNDNTSREYGQIDGQILEEARETLTIERIKEGEYIFALHGYRVPPDSDPVEVTVEFQKSSPYSHIFKKKISVSHNQEVPFAAFYIDSEGNVKDLQLNENIIERFIQE